METDRESPMTEEDGSFAASIGLKVTGSAKFLEETNVLLEEYNTVFSTGLGSKPEDLPLLDVIDDANRGRAQNHSDEG